MGKTIGVIYAMDMESEGYSDFLSAARKESVYGFDFTVKELDGGNKVVFVKCGIGKVNSTVIAALLKEHFSVDKLILTGIAGSLSRELKLYDVLVADRFVQHDVENFGEELGFVDGPDKIYFTPDADVYSIVLNISGGKTGLLASGEQFISRQEQQDRILKNFPESIAVDMESGAVAQACERMHLPFACIKVISDAADGVDYWEFAPIAGKILNKIVLAVLNSDSLWK